MPSAMVLSAGLGTRLRPLSDEVPKPLLPVGDRPLLVSILENLHELCGERLWVNAHHLPKEIASVLDSLGFKVRVSLEENILGTAGGIRAMKDQVRDWPLMIHNGDIALDVSYRELPGPAPRWLRLCVSLRAAPGGTVGLGSRGQVVRLRGEVFGEEVASADYAGVCWVAEPMAARLPEQGCLIGDGALPLLRQGEPVQTQMLSAGFTDVGTPSDYLRANLGWLSRRKLDNWVAADAQISPSVTMRSCVVLGQCRVRGTGVLERCVLLAGAKAQAPLRDCVVTPSGRVVSVG